MESTTETATVKSFASGKFGILKIDTGTDTGRDAYLSQDVLDSCGYGALQRFTPGTKMEICYHEDERFPMLQVDDIRIFCRYPVCTRLGCVCDHSKSESFTAYHLGVPVTRYVDSPLCIHHPHWGMVLLSREDPESVWGLQESSGSFVYLPPPSPWGWHPTSGPVYQDTDIADTDIVDTEIAEEYVDEDEAFEPSLPPLPLVRAHSV